MSMTMDAAPSRAFSSSSVTRTYWSLATSYPLTRSLRATTSWSTGQYVCCRIRVPHLAWSRLKETPAEEAAVYSLIGMDTSPNEIVAEPIECGGITLILCVSKSHGLAHTTSPAGSVAGRFSNSVGGRSYVTMRTVARRNDAAWTRKRDSAYDG